MEAIRNNDSKDRQEKVCKNGCSKIRTKKQKQSCTIVENL
jgi:hypothetical protein